MINCHFTATSLITGNQEGGEEEEGMVQVIVTYRRQHNGFFCYCYNFIVNSLPALPHHYSILPPKIVLRILIHFTVVTRQKKVKPPKFREVKKLILIVFILLPLTQFFLPVIRTFLIIIIYTALLFVIFFSR